MCLGFVENSIIINKLDLNNEEENVNTYLCCINCMKTSKVKYMKKQEEAIKIQCPNCNRKIKAKYLKLFNKGYFIKKVIDEPVYILINKQGKILKDYHYGLHQLNYLQRNDIKISKSDLTNDFEILPASVFQKMFKDYYWYNAVPYNKNQQSIEIKFDKPRKNRSIRFDNDTHYKMSAWYVTEARLRASDGNLWLFPKNSKRTITVPKKLNNLNGISAFDVTCANNNTNFHNNQIDNIRPSGINAITKFKKEVLLNLETQAQQYLEKTNIYKYHSNDISSLSTIDKAILSLYPNYYYLYKLTNYSMLPRLLDLHFRSLNYRKKRYSNEMKEKEFLNNFLGVNISKKEKKLLIEYPYLILFYDSFVQTLKYSNNRIEMLNVLIQIIQKADIKIEKLIDNVEINFHVDESYEDKKKFNFYVADLRKLFKVIFTKNNANIYVEKFLKKIMISEITDNGIHPIYDGPEKVYFVKRIMFDLIQQMDLLITHEHVKSLRKLILNFINSTQLTQNFEEKLINYILENNFTISDISAYNYDKNISESYNKNIDDWKFRLVPSQDYLLYMSNMLHNCVGSSPHYHEEIIHDKSYIVHGYNGKNHLCIQINKKGIKEARTKYNELPEVLGKDTVDTLSQYENDIVQKSKIEKNKLQSV